MHNWSLDRIIRATLLRWFLLPVVVILLLQFVFTLGIQRDHVEERHLRDAMWLQGVVGVYLEGVHQMLNLAIIDRAGRVDERVDTMIGLGRDGSSSVFHRVVALDSEFRIVDSAPDTLGVGTDLSGLISGVSVLGTMTLTVPHYSTVAEAIVITVAQKPRGYTHVIAAELNLELLQKQLSESVPGGGDQTVFLTDRYGNVIAHPDFSLVQRQANLGGLEIMQQVGAGRPATTIAREDGRTSLYSAVCHGASGWTVVAYEPLSSAFASVIGVFVGTMAALAGISVFTLLLFRHHLRRSVVNPLMRFAAAIDQEAGSSETAMPPSGGSFAELEVLLYRFEEMTTRVHRREQQLIAAAEEKEALVREIHHRVKNNLNVIASLLSLQAENVDSVEGAMVAFEESKSRIYSIARVHESLYGTDNLSEVDMSAYIRELVYDLRTAYGRNGTVDIHLQVDEIELGIEHAIPCGIILNELLTNSYRHAFPDGRRGEISVAFTVRETGRYRLTVADDGVGLTAAAAEGSSRSLGMRLVRILVEQLGGVIEFSGENGAEFVVEWPRAESGA
ncbi:MAG: histidine kinase dimerization/phosphoacceptor domain -containing protein [Alkalispirochaeta sp.]